MHNPEYEQIKAISNRLLYQYNEKTRLHSWEGSPFEWIAGGIKSRTKGKLGEDMVKAFLEENGFSVHTSPDSEADLVVEGRRVEVKLSTLWSMEKYRFQQIRKQNYDILFCLGLSPHSVHAWTTLKSNIVWSDMSHQHGGTAGGSAGKNTWWIECDPQGSPHQWMRPQNGDLTKVCGELRRIISS
ncbi:MAG: hypothetical protein OXR07_08175 [Nitrospira sp.]|nr:hypothetical protein [Nitrospira sp.]MDD9860188.1 hypothetical protein [Nitrospira sp.]